ncbi:MAG: hypothetical protein RL379_836 [Bacillota bacterium]|jgi:1-acyl-sn-glycerol-3-phosphate acyltransferase
MASRRYTYWHHGFFLSIFRFIFGPIFRLYYRFSAKRIPIKKSGPYLILANHTAEFDIIFLDMLFDAPLYFVASDQLLNSGKGSWFLKTFFNPIPKSKSVADLALVKRMKSVIEEGGNICIFPEGNATMNGGPSPIPTGMGRLIKFLGVPVKFIKIEGLYFSAPRWSYFRKFGPSTMHEISTLSPLEFNQMDSETLETFVKDTLHISAYEKPLGEYHGKHLAEGLHKLIFTCPSCQGLFSTYSQGRHLYCRECTLDAMYDEKGLLTINHVSQNLIEHDHANLQRFHEQMFVKNKNLKIEYPCEVSYWKGNPFRRSKFQKGIIKISKEGVKLTLKGEEKSYTFDKIFAEAIQVRTKLLLYPSDGPMLLIRLPRGYSPYGLLNVIKWHKQALKEETNDGFIKRPAASFLGL